MDMIRQGFTDFQQELPLFPIVLMEILTHSNFRKPQFHMWLKRNLDYYIPFDREFHGLQNHTKLCG